MKFLTGVIHSKLKLFMNKFTSLTKQFWIFFTAIFLTKLFFVMIKIHRGLIMKLEKYWLKKNEIFKQYVANRKSQTDYERLQLISNSLTETIRSSKKKFYYKVSTKLANPLRHQKPIDRYSKLLSMAKKFQ